ncbi:MAG TPA: PfkB family carbohydrate kinase [Stellaceae bacterium]|nr:PfkB family carbohydrate kinase [Stellaceae bacterium]
MAARRAGAEVALAGAVGKDGFAGVARDLLRRDGVDLGLVGEVGRPTGCAQIMVGAGGENLIAVASGANEAVTAAQVPDRLLGPGTTVVCQMEVPAAETVALIRRAHRAGARTVLNLAPALPIDPAVFGALDWLIANEGEAAALGTAHPRRGLVVTLGERGAVAFLADGARLEVPALAITPVDTTGAGDTFVGAFAAGLDLGFEVADALRFASTAAGLACLGRGAQPAMPRREAIVAALPPSLRA